MIHIWNIAKFLVMFIFQLIMTIIGWFVIPIGMLWMEEYVPSNRTSVLVPNQKRFKWKWFDAIWGNSEDGIADIYYVKKYVNDVSKYEATWWRTYNFMALRNPIHNLALAMGVHDFIDDYKWKGNRYTEDRIGHEGFVWSTAIGVDGTEYHMYRWCKLWTKTHGIELNIGYKNFNIGKLPKYYKYSFTVSINPFKKFEPAR